MLRYLTAGESHGRGLLVILDGLPAGLPVEEREINSMLSRRQGGYGRGERMKIEKDRVRILSGLRGGKTLGSPIGILIPNRDWENWRKIMDPFSPPREEPLFSPRPGHADLPGALKYHFDNLRDVLERASARETAARVAVGAFCKLFLSHFGMDILGYVIQIGKIKVGNIPPSFEEKRKKTLSSPLFCPDREKEERMKLEIDKSKERRDTLGGAVEVMARGVPPGLGSYTQWDKRIDGRIARSFMSIPGIKCVEIGMGKEAGERYGSEVHDEIWWDEKRGFYRKTNRAGGIEGGVTNGEPVVVRATMKPIPTLGKPLHSVDMRTKKDSQALQERADVCVVPAVSVIGEAVLSFELALAFLEKFGGDCIEEIEKSFKRYLKYLKGK